METSTDQFLLEAIKYELKMHEIYSAFQHLVPEDSEFWGELAAEEISHADIIRKIEPLLMADHEILDKYLAMGVNSMSYDHQKIINDFKLNITRMNAFKIALGLETNATEVHYQTVLESGSNSKVSKIFKVLNGNDKDHARRIQEYMNKSNIQL